MLERLSDTLSAAFNYKIITHWRTNVHLSPAFNYKKFTVVLGSVPGARLLSIAFNYEIVTVRSEEISPVNSLKP